MAQTHAYCQEQYQGLKIRSEFTRRRLTLGYTYQSLSDITGIKPNRIVKLAGLGGSAHPDEVTALAKALIVAESVIREWLICM